MSVQYLDNRPDDYRQKVSDVINTLKLWNIDNSNPYVSPADQHIVDDLIKWHYIGPRNKHNDKWQHFINWHTNRYYPDRTIDNLLANAQANAQANAHTIDDCYALLEQILQIVAANVATN